MTTLFKHPEYIKRMPAWARANDLYEGKPDVMRGATYLWPHAFEEKPSDPDSKRIRASRERRTKYLKLPRLMKEILTGFFFRKAMTFDKAALELLADYEKDIDGRGTSIQTFIKRDMLADLLRFGDVNVFVDAPGVKARNQKEEKALGLRPFMSTLSPLAVKDWYTEAQRGEGMGRVMFLRHEYELLAPRKDETEKPVVKLYSASLKLINGVYAIAKYEKEDESDSEKQETHDPAESLKWKQSGPLIIPEPKLDSVPVARITGEAWLDDVCDEAERYHNLRSNRDNILYYQGYQKLWAAGIDPKDEAQVKALSEYIMTILPENGSMGAVEPPSLAAYESALGESLNNAFKLGLYQLRSLPADSRAVQGAETIAEEKEITFARVEAAIEDMENCVNEALGYFAQFAGVSNPGKVAFNREISPESWDEILAISQAFADEFRKVPVVRKEVLKKAVKRLNLSQEATDDAITAIDEMKDEPEEPKVQMIGWDKNAEEAEDPEKNKEEEKKVSGEA